MSDDCMAIIISTVICTLFAGRQLQVGLKPGRVITFFPGLIRIDMQLKYFDRCEFS